MFSCSVSLPSQVDASEVVRTSTVEGQVSLLYRLLQTRENIYKLILYPIVYSTATSYIENNFPNHT